jgi:hypothetical protein
MKLHKELQEGMAEGLERLPEFMQLARRRQWSEAITLLESLPSSSIVSVYLSRLRAELGGPVLAEIIEEWKAVRGLTERQILTNIHLGDFQKKVLAKIVAANDEHDAYDDVSIGDINMIAARDTLEKIGMIDVDQAEEVVSVTSQGMEAMKKENLVDDMGQLTDEAQNYIYDDEDQQAAEPQPGVAPGAEPQQGMGGQPGAMGQQDMGGQGGGPNLDFGGPPMESIIRETSGSGLTQDEHRDIRAFVEGNIDWYDMSDTAQDKLYSLWVHEMPYGTAKARTGDPDQWIADKMQGDIEDMEKRTDHLRFAKRTYRSHIDDYIEDLFA